jgi:hypothetical protein
MHPSLRNRIMHGLLVLLLVGVLITPVAQAAPETPRDLLLPGSAPAGALAAHAAQSMSGLWLPTSPLNNTENPTVAVDPAGGIHVAFSAYSPVNGNFPVYYAYCPANCSSDAGWTVLAVAQAAAWGGHVRIAITPAGRPRLLWFYEVGGALSGTYNYAECDTGCTQAANWHAVALMSNSLGPLWLTRYFALDPQGRPRFVYTDTAPGHTGTYYTYCDASCRTVGNWHEVQIDTNYLLYDFSLAFNAAGQPRLAFRANDAVWYAECNGNCAQASAWNMVATYAFGDEGALALALDSVGRPRMALYQGSAGYPEADNTLYYAWCNSVCLDQNSWNSSDVGLPAHEGLDVDLALDSLNRPRLVYFVDDLAGSNYGLGYGYCTGNCETSTPGWVHQLVETPDDLDASDPVPPAQGCSLSSWLNIGRYPALALAGEDPRIVYNAEHVQGGTCSIHTDVKLVRLALAGGGGGSPRPRAYLPLLRRR